MFPTFHDLVEVTDKTGKSPIILHAPHGGTQIPATVRDQFVVDDAGLRAEQEALVDHATDTLARKALDDSPVSSVINQLSRLVVDVERFDDASEEKNAVGMGVLYTHGAERQLLRNLPADTSALKQFYNDYAATMTRLTERALAHHGRALIIDLHSYPTTPQGHELHTHEPRPELCVGFEPFHCSPALRENVREAFAGFAQGDNQTFHGSYVPLPHYRSDSRVQSVMLEIRRDQYLDEKTVRLDPARINRLAAGVRQLIRTCTG